MDAPWLGRSLLDMLGIVTQKMTNFNFLCVI
jgi:hypothetical protein